MLSHTLKNRTPKMELHSHLQLEAKNMLGVEIHDRFDLTHRAVAFRGDCLSFLATVPNNSVSLVVTSPPYNIGKAYERKNPLASYIESQRMVIQECVNKLKPGGSICWQVGNYVDNGSIVPLDYLLHPIFAEAGLKMRNRIVWHFEHGLHCSRRLSGRYEVIMWYTKGDDYYFNVDPIRVPQKYPGKKYFKGPKAGEYSCNPLGKNPGDLWVIPNVKSNHVEKTDHPCQFPVELIERLVLALAPEDSWVLDPFLGVGTSVIAAIRHGRRGAGAELMRDYWNIAVQRIGLAIQGDLPVRPMNKPVFDPDKAGLAIRSAPWLNGGIQIEEQMVLMDKASDLPKTKRTEVTYYKTKRTRRAS
jgi:adenine-specific DNA-methyltransferase